MRKFAFENYIGPNGFVFMSCEKTSDTKVSLLANKLANEGVRLYYDLLDNDPLEVSNVIESVESTVFFISQKAVDNLQFRNEINFAINEKKNIVCFNMDGCKLSHGLDMQLANYPVYSFVEAEDTKEKLLEHGVITQDVLGGEMERRNISIKKQLIILAIIVISAVALFVGGSAIVKNRIDYYSSDTYRITQYGKDVEELNLRDGGYKDISALKGMKARAIYLSGNPQITDFSPLLEVEGLEEVYVSQDMLQYLYRYQNSDFDIIVER